MHTTNSPFLKQLILPEQKIPAPISAQPSQNPWAFLIWAFIVIGIFLRVFHYFDNRSLWIDEVYLASSLIKMDFLQLATPPLAYEQKAPIGFLWIVRLAVLAFGKGEMALRLFPLICAIASLFVFRSVCRFFLKPLGVTVAVGLLALAPPIVYHAVEVKQYSSDLLATALALYSYTRYYDKLKIPQLFIWGTWGAVLVWFSYSVIFTLAGMAFAVCLTYLFQKNWKALFYVLIPFSMWLISFAVNYFLFTYKHADSEWLLYWFRVREAFMPFPPTSAADIKWFFSQAYLLLEYPLGLPWHFMPFETSSKLFGAFLNVHFIPVPFIVTGIMVLYRKDKTTLMVLLFPVLLTLLASGLEIYPFYERLLVFMAPLLILLIAFGTQRIAELFRSRPNWAYVLPFLILLGPLHASAQQVHNTELFGGRKHWHLRDALLYINDRVREGDVVYISWNALPEYRYYKEVYQFQFKAIEGKDARQNSQDAADYFINLKPDIEALTSYDRAWVLFNKKMGANIGEKESPNDVFAQEIMDGQRFVEKLSVFGKKKDAYLSADTDAILFDFSNN